MLPGRSGVIHARLVRRSARPAAAALNRRRRRRLQYSIHTPVIPVRHCRRRRRAHGRYTIALALTLTFAQPPAVRLGDAFADELLLRGSHGVEIEAVEQAFVADLAQDVSLHVLAVVCGAAQCVQQAGAALDARAHSCARATRAVRRFR